MLIVLLSLNKGSSTFKTLQLKTHLPKEVMVAMFLLPDNLLEGGVAWLLALLFMFMQQR
jgi:hypothetical protein